MSNIITTNFNILSAQYFMENAANNNSLYLFLGRQIPWENDSSPPNPISSNFHYNEIWNNMIGMKLVNQSNMCLVIPNNIYQPNIVYTEYSDKVDVLNLASNVGNFYIVTSSNEVYKCISNNSGGLSTQQPSGLGSNSSNYIQTLSDGYQWKYMLNAEITNPFLTNEWFPIPLIAPTNSYQNLIENSAIPGGIMAMTIQNKGNNYINGSQSYILNIIGDGSNANGYANISNGQLQNIVITDFGNDYTYASVSLTDTNGSGGIVVPIISPPGDGSNPINELGAYSVMISIQTSNSESGYFTISNSFRQNGLIMNPLLSGSSNVATSPLLQTSTYINVGGGSGTYINNEQVYQGANLTFSTFSGIVIDYNNNTSLIRLNNIIGLPEIGSILIGANSGSQRYITSTQNPDIQNYTGMIIDFDNTIPIQRYMTQTENFQFVQTFT